MNIDSATCQRTNNSTDSAIAKGTRGASVLLGISKPRKTISSPKAGTKSTRNASIGGDANGAAPSANSKTERNDDNGQRSRDDRKFDPVAVGWQCS
jgi:hypothetical protein